jgi:pimeloyl-ACP methyl ester carboxylesterase
MMRRWHRALTIGLALGVTGGLAAAAFAHGRDNDPWHGPGPKHDPSSLRSPLVLKDEAMFFVNGQLVTSNYPSAGNGTTPPTPATFAVNQMFVHYRSPKEKKHKLPIIMVHGSGLTGMSWETTPDGREGWGTYFTREGFDTYVVDFPGRGRAGFNVTPLNQAKFENNVALQPSIARTGAEGAWTAFRFGDVYPVPYPDTAFPVNSMLQFSSQGAPNAEATLSAGEATIPAAIAALLDKIGPAILMSHSQGGRLSDPAVALRPNLIKMMVHVESSCPALLPDQVTGYKSVQHVLYIHGDHVVGNPASTGQPRLDLCTAAMNTINANGGRAKLVQLPSVGLKGNTHMLMQDKNNLKVADWLIREISKRGY